MNRLTPEIVSDAYARVELTPARMQYGPNASFPGRCDALYAVAAARESPIRRPSGMTPDQYLAQLAGVSADYATGFTWGWDCQTPDPNREWSAEARQGFEDGRAAWLAVGEGKEARNG